MILEHLSKKKKILLFIFTAILVMGAFLFLYSSIIFQEGNPWPQMKGITQLNFTSKTIVKLSSKENRYMTKSKNGQNVIKNFMKDNGYDFTEQMGSSYFFIKDNLNRVIVTHKYYSRSYSLWNITEEIKNNENNILNELRECLPKSDITSHERCSELLATIIDFDDCIRAGFSIMKSNPPKCATPDGRTFIQVD